MSDGHLAVAQTELEIDEVMASTVEVQLQTQIYRKYCFDLLISLSFRKKTKILWKKNEDLMASYEDPKIIDYVMQNDKSQRAEIGIKENFKSPNKRALCSISYAQEKILKT